MTSNNGASFGVIDLVKKAGRMRKNDMAETALAMLQNNLPRFLKPVDQASLLVGIAECHKRLEQGEQAETCLRQSITLQPNNIYAMVSLAKLLENDASQDRVFEAFNLYTNVLAYNPGNKFAGPALDALIERRRTLCRSFSGPAANAKPAETAVVPGRKILTVKPKDPARSP